MGVLVDGFGGKISGELIRASDWNGMLAAVETLVAGVQTAIEARLEPLEDTVGDLGTRVTALEGAITDFTNVAATLRARYRRMNLTAASARFVIGQRGAITATVTSFDGTALDLTNPATRPWVDFVTVWGVLVAAPGFVSRSGTGGRTVAVQVNASGQATVLLQADHAASFSEAEHVQVESALATRVTVGAQEMSVSEAILGGATPASSTVQPAFQAMTRAYTASGTNTTQRYLDTYYVQSPARVAPQLGFIPTNWTDYLVTVFAFVKPDGDPVSPDGAMASGSIQVTFRDWVRHWIVDDFFVDLSGLVLEYRGVLPGLIHTDLRVSVDGVMDEIERRVRGGGILGGQREFAAATDAVKTVRVQNAPGFFEDAMEAVSGGIAVQRAVSYGEAVTPRAGTSAQSARAVAGSTAKAYWRSRARWQPAHQPVPERARRGDEEPARPGQGGAAGVSRGSAARRRTDPHGAEGGTRRPRRARDGQPRARGESRPPVRDRLRPPDWVTAMGMWETYLLPEEVSARHAREVLDFLNQAPDAKTIAEAVEFPRELDVGMRVAQRILTRRAELNGFRTLDELYAVPYVGPERFTEIVVSLSGARPPRIVGGISRAELAELRQSIDMLRSLLQAGVQARLWSVQGTIWLGQNATLFAHVQDAAGRPLVDQPVTFTTTWGELSALSGVQTITGNAVTARTNDVGLVELRLGTRFQAPLSDAQRIALELAAGRLPLAAAWPTAASDVLNDLVQQYRAPASDDLREAIDAAFREYGSSVQRAEHRGQALAQWGRIPVSIACFVHDEGDDRGQRHLALVTHTMDVRNWLPAFLAAFEHDVAADRRLGEELKRAPTDVQDADVFLNDVFISVKAFVNTERGELGQTIRTRAAQDELQQFFQTSVAALPEKLRLNALGSVGDAAATIGQGGLPVFKAVDATRRDLTGTFTFNADLLAASIEAVQTGPAKRADESADAVHGAARGARNWPVGANRGQGRPDAHRRADGHDGCPQARPRRESRPHARRRIEHARGP